MTTNYEATVLALLGGQPTRPSATVSANGDGWGEELHYMLDQRYQGATLEEIAVGYGLTRERIRQLLAKADPDHSARARLARYAEKDRRKAQQLRQRRQHGKRCRVCWGPILRGAADHKYVCCSPRCSELWSLCRYHLDPNEKLRHLRTNARWSVEHADRVDPIRLRSAQRVLEGKVEHGKHGGWLLSPQIADGLDEIERLRARHR